MLIYWTEKAPKYSDFQERMFEKYYRKVSAIKSNIMHSSLTDGDKKKLLQDLSSKLKPTESGQ